MMTITPYLTLMIQITTQSISIKYDPKIYKIWAFDTQYNISYRYIRMTTQKSKLSEYLQTNNYQMAITTYNNAPEQLTEREGVELARAFHVNENYEKVVEICDKLLGKTNNDGVFFEVGLLMVKAGYLGGRRNGASVLKQIQSRVGRAENREQARWWTQAIKQVRETLQYETNSNVGKYSRAQLQQFTKQFKSQFEKQQFENPLTDCLPMFIVSRRWLSQFYQYTGLEQPSTNSNSQKQSPAHPGPITHFEILDHRHNMLYDPIPQKKYTNYAIYPGGAVVVLPRSCWEMLKGVFMGTELKRYNVWVSGKPREIITEIYLKKIRVRKGNESYVYEMQITKKETWGGFVKKLKSIWKQHPSYILLEQFDNGSLKPVPQNTFLEQANTIDKIFIFAEPPSQQKDKDSLSSSNRPVYKCHNCGKTEDLKFCQCKSVKYCNRQCQKEDRDRHRKKCQLECSHLNQKAAVLESFNLPERSYGGRKGLVGLRNLGNTCYMNSGLQCLSNTKQITEYFMKNDFIKEINHNNPLGTKGNLACAYAQLIRQMWTGTDGAISPFNLKKIIGKFAAQFSGYGQQDSQEFISYLIDGLQEDLNLVKKKETFQTPDEIVSDEEGSLRSEQNYEKRIKSYIRDLMVGQFKSTVICQRCNKMSICFDPYLLLALPIPGLKQNQVFYISSDCSKGTKKINFTSDNYAKISDLRQQLNNYYSVGKRYGSYFKFMIVELKKFAVLDADIKDSTSITEISNKITHPDVVLLAYEILEPRSGEISCQVEYLYNGEKKCFPRFINIARDASPALVMQLLEKSVTRYKKQSRYSRQEYSIKDLAQLPQIAQNRIRIRLKTNIDMLICSSEYKVLKLHAMEKRTTLYDCLNNFTNTEILEDHNKWYCNKCKQHVRASKQMEIYKSNQILVLAFKRFSRGFKVKDFIDFPVEGLNMGPYIKSNRDKKPILYDLYGIVNHYGTMSGGHYTAYCKNFLNREWHQFDDSHVSKVRDVDIVTESAYVLFYRRRE